MTDDGGGSDRPTDRVSSLDRLRERKIVQWSLAYLAAAWLAVQVLDIVGERFNWPNALLRALIVLVGFGFFLTLVIAWYHGERGRQRVGGTELLLISAVLALAGLATSRVTRDASVGPWGDLVRIPQASAAPLPRTGQPMVRSGPSLAVLPFDNLSSDSENAHFADGIHEDILNHLAAIGGLTLISRRSVLRYRDTDLTIPQIAAELGIDAVMEGSVRRQGSRIRVVAQLIDAQSDAHLWSATFDRDMEDVFAVQSEIARAVATALQTTLTPEQESRIGRAPTGSLTAYDYYARGREAYGRYTREANEEAIRLFGMALELDSAYSNAWAGLGDAYSMRRLRFDWGYEWTDSAIVASQQAIDRAPDLPDGHKALGLAYGTKGWYRRAIASYLRAVDLSPSHSAAINNIAAAYSALDAFDEGFKWRRRSFAVAPNGPFSRSNTAISYINLGERAAAEQWIADALALNSRDLSALAAQAFVHRRWGELDRSRSLQDSLRALDPTSARRRVDGALVSLFSRDYPKASQLVDEAFAMAPQALLLSSKWAWTIAGFAHLQMGDREKANPLFQQALTINQIDLDRGLDMPRAPWENASIFAALGHTEEALEWAELAYEMGRRRYWEADVDPMFDSIREHPGFVALLDRMREDVESMRLRVRDEEIAAGSR